MSFVSMLVSTMSGVSNPGGTTLSCEGTSSPLLVSIGSGALKLSSHFFTSVWAGKPFALIGSSGPLPP